MVLILAPAETLFLVKLAFWSRVPNLNMPGLIPTLFNYRLHNFGLGFNGRGNGAVTVKGILLPFTQLLPFT